MLNSLSGRFLILTTVFVMLAEILIFVPSIARFREDFLMSRLERAQIASLATEPGPSRWVSQTLGGLQPAHGGQYTRCHPVLPTEESCWIAVGVALQANLGMEI